MKKQNTIIISVIISVLIGLLLLSQGRTTKVNSNRNIPVYVADSQSERLKGLSGRDNLPKDRGMLFIFDNDGKHGIWMKDMKFNIDVVWLDSDNMVVDTVLNISPESYPKIYSPSVYARYVLELSAGQVLARNISKGTQLSFTTVID